ncbi:DUF3604 domain-containing protein [Mesorhizobium kowhaii]|uniref:DUF3604 domain-containing protein n=1 Tax=Mesorhizobium kowhaii TaxID=1300272 RepID=UPI000DADCB94|nr:DUF3604 domain-containing protein [Mesorhizobium kowhaii]
MIRKPLTITSLVLLTVCASAVARAQDAGTYTVEEAGQAIKARPYSPYAGRNFPARPLFGDTHLHTALSFDAGAAGARLGPREAYKFAKGEEVISSTGQPAKLSRPLDFLVVADHSDNMGWFTDFMAGKPEILQNAQAREWYDMIQSGHAGEAAWAIVVTFSQGKFPPDIIYQPGNPAYRSVWQSIISAAEEANDPGHFTAFIGFEWTSLSKGNNLHRNVIFRDGAEKAGLIEPYTTQPPVGSNNPRDLWKWLRNYEDKTGGDVLAIAHNGNLSNGEMFPIIEPVTGKEIDREYAEQRAHWEVLYETTQMKGDGESHPFLSPNDEFANFEKWDKGNLDLSVKKTPDMLEFEYTRSALKNGLKLEAKLGVNPYKFGLVGSTDSHTGLSTADDDNFFGKISTAEPSPERWSHPFMANPKLGLKIMGWETTASGYAAVWAQENTRASIFDAMKRRETYATTGPRMVVRFFGGFDFDEADANSRSPAIAGYTKGVPMGGDLTQAPAGKVPTFLVAALKDPIGANLDRYQIIKGWLDAAGEVHEKVYDVAWSGDRKPGADGKLPPVGNTVDVPNATWTNTIGAPELIAVWKDPDFDPSQRAFYYGRVIEIPTPRWPAYDAKYFGIKMSPDVTMTTQERAYTSPIWYTPAG